MLSPMLFAAQLSWNMGITDQIVAFPLRFRGPGIMDEEYEEMIQRRTVRLRRYELTEEFID